MRLLPYGQWAFGESRVQKKSRVQKSRVLSAEGKIREIREIRVRNKYIRAIRSSCERTAANKDL